MFTLTNLPTKSYQENYFPLVQIEGTNNLNSNFPIVNINTNKETISTTPTIIDIPIEKVSNGNEIINIDLSNSGINNLSSINLYGKNYEQVNNIEDLSLGTYYYDQINNELVVYLEPNSYSSNTVIKINTNIEKLKTNVIKENPYLLDNNNFPNFIKEYNLKGTISITRNYNDHPSCTFTLFSNKKNLLNVENTFNAYKNKELYKQKFIFYGIPFRIRSYGIKISNLQNRPKGEYEITINFEGWYIYLLNKNIPLNNNPNNNNSSSNNLQCNINANNKPGISTNGSPTDINKLRISFSTLASRIGLEYAGTNFNYEYDKSTSKDATVSFSSILEPKVIGNSEYTLYSNSFGILTLPWLNSNIFYADSSEIFQEPSINYNCAPISIAPSTLNWNNSNADNPDNSNEDTYVNKKPEYEYKPPKRTTVVTGVKNAENPPSNYQIIQTLDLNYDKSGQTQEKVTRVYEGSIVISETTDIYGLAYTAIEVVSAGNKIYSAIGTNWKKVSSETVTHNYDSSTGYYLGNDVTGFKLCRFKQESDELETISLETNDPMIPAYQFKTVQTKGHTRYVLRQHRDYYKDLATNSSKYIIYDWCTTDGQLIKRSMKDPTYAEDMFIGVEETYKQSFSSMKNPESTSDTPLPDFTTGEVFHSLSETKIYSSKNVVQSLSSFTSTGGVLRDNVIGSDFTIEEDRYCKFNKNYSANDSQFANCIQDTKIDECNGRPGTANRRPSYYVLKDDKEQLAEQKKDTNKNNNKIEHIVYSYPYLSTDAVTGSLTYDCDSLQKAINAANTEYSKQKTTGEGSLSITTFFNPNFIEGNKFYFTYGFDELKTRILSVNHSLEIQGIDENNELIITGNSTLGLGLDSDGTVTHYTRPVPNTNTPNNSNNNNTLNLLDIYNQGYELGKLIDFEREFSKGRGNF